MTEIRWNHHTSEWTATLPEGTQVHSRSLRELEEFLDGLQNSPAARHRQHRIDLATAVAVAVILGVTAVAAWLW